MSAYLHNQVFVIGREAMALSLIVRSGVVEGPSLIDVINIFLPKIKKKITAKNYLTNV